MSNLQEPKSKDFDAQIPLGIWRETAVPGGVLWKLQFGQNDKPLIGWEEIQLDSAHVASPVRARWCLHFDALRRALAEVASAFFSMPTQVHAYPALNASASSGATWFVFEFAKSGQRFAVPLDANADRRQDPLAVLPPLGIGGILLQCKRSEAGLHWSVDDSFVIGPIPKGFPLLWPKLIMAVLARVPLAAPIKNDYLISIDEVCLPWESLVPSLAHAPFADKLQLHRRDWYMQCSEDALQFSLPTGAGVSDLLTTSLSALEAKEYSQHFAELESDLVQEKFVGAAQFLKKALEAQPQNAFILRRVSQLLVARLLPQEFSLTPEALSRLETLASADAVSLTAHSALLHCLYHVAGDSEKLLERLSKFGRNVVERVPGIARLPTFESLLSELLGDAWAAKNAEKAWESYQFVLTRQATLPRLLWKAARLAKGQSELPLHGVETRATWRQRERQSLEKLLLAEKRQRDIFALRFRLAQIFQQGILAQETFSTEQMQDALHHAAFAASSPDATVASIQLLGDLLCINGKPEDAIANLDRLIKASDGPASRFSPAELAKIEVFIADIWAHALKRPELACIRYRAAAMRYSDFVTWKKLAHCALQTQSRDDLDAALQGMLLALESPDQLNDMESLWHQFAAQRSMSLNLLRALERLIIQAIAAKNASATRHCIVSLVQNVLHEDPRQSVGAWKNIAARLVEAHFQEPLGVMLWRAIFLECSEDPSVWVPYYDTVHRHGAPDDQLVCLRDLVPRFEQNPLPLKDSPFRLESLQSQLRTLESTARELVRAQNLPADPFTLRPDMSRVSDASRAAVDTKTQTRVHTLDPMKWRDFAAMEKPPADFAQIILDAEELPKLEKHLAVQAAILRTREMGLLNQWNMRTWRHPLEVDYSMGDMQRLPQEFLQAAFRNPVVDCLRATATILARVYHKRFSRPYLMDRLKRSEADLVQLRSKRRWGMGILAQNSSKNVELRMGSVYFHPFHIQGLEAEFFVDLYRHEFYFDESYYVKLPATVLAHRLRQVAWEVKAGMHVPLRLDPVRMILPVMTELQEHLQISAIDRALKSVQMKRSKVIASVRDDKWELLKGIFARTGWLDEARLVQNVSQLQWLSWGIVLADTLDFVGVMEAICGFNLADYEATAAMEMLQQNDVFEELLKIWLRIDVRAEISSKTVA